MSKDQRKQQLKILNTYEKLLPVAERERSEETMLHVVTNEGHSSTSSGDTDTTTPFVPYGGQASTSSAGDTTSPFVPSH